ncbi:hypothetical protein GALL_279780 [mine drainage metagenome]|uniref:Uncharacterized protein n=1 Tax=mine drainage metagenome TaxID=410659 RepID=A0A1J5R2G1_9ZZZZ
MRSIAQPLKTGLNAVTAQHLRTAMRPADAASQFDAVPAR